MAKLSRTALKGLVKECLIEILSEGISSDVLIESSRPRKNKSKKVTPEREFLAKKKSLDNASFKKTADQASKNLTSDPVMQSIFADTAMTTLQEQISAGKRPAAPAGSDRAAQIVSQSDPEDLFEDTTNWASLAFADKVPSE